MNDILFRFNGEIVLLPTISNIKKNITVIGVIKKIELWDIKTLDKYEKNKDNFTDSDFDELSNQINF